MLTWIALFRGINVGGRNSVRMAALRSELEADGLADVRTYIQSGNVVFAADEALSAQELESRIAALVEQHHGFRPEILVLGLDDLIAAMDANPFPEAVGEPRSLHYLFLAAPPPAPDLDAIEAVRATRERWQLIDDVFYLHAPDGIGRSKLAASAERHLGVVATGRNHRTVVALRELADGH